MTDKAISPLRQRMIEDMTARHFAEKVQTEEGERTHPRSRGTAVADCGAEKEQPETETKPATQPTSRRKSG